MKAEQTHELKILIETRLGEIYAGLMVGEPSKRLRKVFARAAKKVSGEVKAHIKDEAKREKKRKRVELKALKTKRKNKTVPKAKVAKD